ncbi:hypothetical protein FRC14_003601 [Serendipita sp. 396]|nr:hypothetical protein FRC14_003601 [Serendipita sp. 396]KAG8785344.1 hypothetical protein FRC15_001563 [Serendipita sp. 397]KAG8798788.1 hypothetical protein FRC16_006542 [Serendipita sp. 398]KAG8820022.1 hypothetical protein FRC18_011864 [Serendipita sp. 400]KAG8827322.1 hypothetical protein FRC19_004190 [Serendipita sp. 401]KAG8853863.1 hypothetical protein FRB91_004255 [Serendipita sp. 411]KAG8867016.1 hypothetical protein FRC20_006936 [Serendipita sp. 405]KAG9057431.1 hypothetical prot
MSKNSVVLPKRRKYSINTLPNPKQIAAARDDLAADHAALHGIRELENAARAELEEKGKQVQARIEALNIQRDAIQANRDLTLSFIAPIRRLPIEILHEIFLVANIADDSGRIPWVVSAVCGRWRTLALSNPRLWARIVLRCTVSCTPDVVRLWVERSGSSVSLSISIRLFHHKDKSHARLPHHSSRVFRLCSEDVNTVHATKQWGFVALFYLTEQKHRWRAFAFECPDDHIEALEYLTGPFPLLEDFWVSCGDNNIRLSTWQWFASKHEGNDTPSLKRLSLQHVHFSWASNMFKNLTDIRIVSPSSVVYPQPATIDSVLNILKNNPDLQSLSLSVPNLQGSVLPNPEVISLPHLTYLSLEGSSHFIFLLQHLKIETVEKFYVKLESPQSSDFAETFRDLLNRSNFPPISILRIYQPFWLPESNLGYLESLPELEELAVGRIPMEEILRELNITASSGTLTCPKLTRLTLQSCPGRRDMESVMPKLIDMVNKRTNGSTPGLQKKLKSLKLYHCGCTVTVEQQSWLSKKLKEFKVDEPTSFAHVHPFVL